VKLRDFLNDKPRRKKKVPSRRRGFNAFTLRRDSLDAPPDRFAAMVESALDLNHLDIIKDFLLPPDEAEQVHKQFDDVACCPAMREVHNLLRTNNFVPARSTNHQVWVSTKKKMTWTTPLTPSDFRSWQNNLSDLKRKLEYHVNRYEQAAMKLSPDEVISAEEVLKAHNRRKKK
jgi:hypothetical protein